MRKTQQQRLDTSRDTEAAGAAAAQSLSGWDAVLEIGTEEMPARFAAGLIRQAEEGCYRLLADAHVESGGVKCYTTPRRIIVAITGLAPKQAPLEVELRGPAARIAYDAEGKPTRALEGFARSAGVSVDSVERRTTEAGEYVFARKTEEGRPTIEVLAEIFPKLIDAFSFPKAMRWGSNDFRFGRPIRWILALMGEDMVEFSYHNIASGRVTYGHRTLAPGPAVVPSSWDLPRVLEAAGVVYDPARRAERIVEEARSLAEGLGGQPVISDELLDEVVNLVEWPTAFSGRFDARYLELPEPCVTTPMVNHQRYFPVRDAGGRLMNAFIGVRNGGTRSIDVVRAGNERVLAARLADAEFFFKEDMAVPLMARVDELKGVMFQEKLGSMYDKALRIGKLASELVGGTPMAALVDVAALMAKADLVTSMVREFTELQGVMGREYALRQGVEPVVAEAIFEHYLPRFADDRVPESPLGAALSVADKVDSIVGYFGIGMIPSGSADPYALRRQAAGVLGVYGKARYVLGLDALVARAAELYADSGVLAPDQVGSVVGQVMEFIGTRLRVAMEEAGIRYDIADAAIAAGIGRPACTWERAWAVTQVAHEPWFAALATAASRVRNIAAHAETAQFTPSLFEERAEHALYKAMHDLESEIRTSVDSRRSGFVDRKAYVSALERMSLIVPPINQYFDAVLVMAKDQKLRSNRLGMLKALHSVLSLVVDLSKIVFASASE